MERSCKGCKKVIVTSSPLSTLDLMSIASGMCTSCMKAELAKVNPKDSLSSENKHLPLWIIVECMPPLSHFRNDLLKIIPSEYNGNVKQFIVKSTLHENTISLSNIQGDHSTLFEWIKANKSIHGLFLTEWTKSTILVAPISEISKLRSYIKEYNDRKRVENEKKRASLPKYNPVKKTQSYSLDDSYDDYSDDFDDQKYDRELEHEFQWETEQRSLDDALDEWENNRGHGLSTYDDKDDHDREY